MAEVIRVTNNEPGMLEKSWDMVKKNRYALAGVAGSILALDGIGLTNLIGDSIDPGRNLMEWLSDDANDPYGFNTPMINLWDEKHGWVNNPFGGEENSSALLFDPTTEEVDKTLAAALGIKPEEVQAMLDDMQREILNTENYTEATANSEVAKGLGLLGLVSLMTEGEMPSETLKGTFSTLDPDIISKVINEHNWAVKFLEADTDPNAPNSLKLEVAEFNEILADLKIAETDVKPLEANGDVAAGIAALQAYYAK